MLIAEQTDITLSKWMEETDRDPELNLTRQAILDKNSHQIPAAYKLYENELTVSVGLLFVDGKIVVPKTLREWVMQVAHGDHASLHKMVEITEHVFWPSKWRDLEKKAADCLVCFRAGKNLKTWLLKSEKKKLPASENVKDEIQLDFIGPLSTEQGKKRYVLVAVDNCSKWLWTRVTKSCSTKCSIKLLEQVIEENGYPKTIKTDNATAFKSAEFRKFTDKHRLTHNFSTPYVHTPIRTVERNLRRLESYIKIYLFEDHNFRNAVNRATRMLRFTISKATGATPFEIHFDRNPRTIFNNLIDLDNDGKGIIENIYDLQGNHLAQTQHEPNEIRRQVFNRTHGKSASTEDMTKELQKRKVRPRIQFFVTKCRKPYSLSSKFETRPRAVTTETEHTVSDGKSTFHKKDIADVTQIVWNNADRFPYSQGNLQYNSTPNSKKFRETNKEDSRKRPTQPE